MHPAVAALSLEERHGSPKTSVRSPEAPPQLSPSISGRDSGSFRVRRTEQSLTEQVQLGALGHGGMGGPGGDGNWRLCDCA